MEKVITEKMAWYMAFPVIMFLVFNRPEFYEKVMYKTKKEMYEPEDPDVEKFKKLQEHFNKKEQKKWEEELSKLSK